MVDQASWILLHYFDKPTQVRLTETVIQQLEEEGVISVEVANEIKVMMDDWHVVH